jgi:hypothetical protein
MSAVVKLSAALPGDEEINGLDSIAAQLVDQPGRIRVALVWLDVSMITDNTETGGRVPTVRVRRIEPLGTVEEIPDEIRKLAARSHEERTGRVPLPFDDVELSRDETLED